jgi:hypothetical protein
MGVSSVRCDLRRQLPRRLRVLPRAGQRRNRCVPAHAAGLRGTGTNPPDARRVAERTGRHGIVPSENGQATTIRSANGSGVIIDRAREGLSGNQCSEARLPVPRDAR